MTARCIIVLFLLLSSMAGAQENWLRRAGGTNLDEATDIRFFAQDGSHYTTGFFSGNANFSVQSLSSLGSTDVFLSRYQSDGTPVWAKRFGGTAVDRGLALAVDDDGNAYVTGIFNGTASFGSIQLTAADSGDVFVVKTDPFGTVLWAVQAGGNFNDSGNGIAVSDNGNVFVTGLFRGTADFGPFTFTSTPNVANDPSADTFLACLNSSGTWQWVQTAVSSGDDRGTDVAVTGNQVSVCGSFSNDITFDDVHPNDVSNAGFIVQFSDSGNESWFSRIIAGQVSPNALAMDEQGRTYVTGENIGNLFFFDNGMVSVPSPSAYSIFIARYSSTGNLDWAQEDGSESLVTSRAITTDGDGVDLFGAYACTMTEYAAELGPYYFTSAGYRDVFISHYSAAGVREWMRSYGGPADDSPGGIARGTQDNAPRIAGSFEKYFHVPTDGEFVTNNTLWTPPQNPPQYPNTADPSYCDGYSGAFLTVFASGGKDIFIAHPHDPDVAPYFYYTDNGSCGSTIIEPCIGYYQSPYLCSEDSTVCAGQQLWVNFHTGSDCFIGPEYEWSWNPGGSALSTYANSSGTYILTVERADGCDAFSDTITVEVIDPTVPLITDGEGINTEEPPSTTPVNLCAPDSTTLEATNTEGTTTTWTLPDGTSSSNLTIIAAETGMYQVMAIDSNGCVGVNSIQVTIIEGLDTIQPYLEFSGENTPVNDTIQVCSNDGMQIELLDLLEQEGFADNTDADWVIYIDGSYYYSEEGTTSLQLEPTESGWYTFVADPYLFIPEPCTIDTTWYPQLTEQVYIEVLPAPDIDPIVSGPTLICPGDTLLLTASGANYFTWFGNGIIAFLSNDSVLVNAPGNYGVSSFEEFENGCSETDSDSHSIQVVPTPEIESDPSYAVICPGDSILLTCESGQAYEWIGPLGQTLGTTQSIYVSAPGSYYCIQTTANCPQESNFIEAQMYSTPYLLAYPNTNLCATEEVTVAAQASPGATISWQPPLSGNGPSISISEPGEYSVLVTGCGITNELTITITQDEPLVALTPDNDVLCPGASLLLTATPGYDTYTWTPGGDGTNELIITTPGTYTVTVADSTGCEGTSAPYSIAAYPLPPPTTIGDDLCAGESTTLTFISNLDAWWSTSPTGEPVVSTEPTISTGAVWSSTTWYAFQDDGTCTSLPAAAEVNVFASSLLEAGASSTALCEGAGTVLSTTSLNSPGMQYTWTSPSGETWNGAVVEIDPIVAADSGWFVLFAQDIFCSSLDSVFISVEDPTPSWLIPGGDAAVCEGNDVELGTSGSNGPWSWTTPQGTSDEATIAITDASEADAGAYTVTVPGVLCPSWSDSAMLDVVPYPVISLEDTSVYCFSGYMTAFVEDGYDAYLWSTGDTVNYAVVPLSGYIAVEVTNFPDCATRDSIQVEEIDCIIDFPNIFTPNGDGDNEYVDFGWLRIPLEEVLVFNRWGTLVRHLHRAPWIWNGRSDEGEELVEGVYYYIAISPKPGKHFHNVEGYIHLTR